jgi:hypothetical protein
MHIATGDTAMTGQKIHIVSVKTRFGDYVPAFSTSALADAYYAKTLREWWDHADMGDWPDDIHEAAALYFESSARDDENDLELDTITVDEEAAG